MGSDCRCYGSRPSCFDEKPPFGSYSAMSSCSRICRPNTVLSGPKIPCTNSKKFPACSSREFACKWLNFKSESSRDFAQIARIPRNSLNLALAAAPPRLVQTAHTTPRPRLWVSERPRFPSCAVPLPNVSTDQVDFRWTSRQFGPSVSGGLVSFPNVWTGASPRWSADAARYG